ncbi:unnamed protein product [Phytophthora fragariaefolia]|uniref:Unnamed protein product n=1 Tax=Phytophthora fragariaefolia TaxID=1490495 RepID=A0A9W6UF83_9STRA|nr:unnamed protein product [Phytophthora fragariaefolia]
MMQFRSVFLDCALYAPTTKANERRKQKLNAIVAQFQFMSRNIELFGYYGFLLLVEKGTHDNLKWLGGKAAKHSDSAKADHDEDDIPAQEDLASVLCNNPSRYCVSIGRILDPSRVDEDGYAWVGNTNRGDWTKLLASEELQKTIGKVEQLLANNESVAFFSQKPFLDTEKGEDDSDYEIDGHRTIRSPTQRMSSINSTPKALLKKGEHLRLTDSDASEGEPSDAEPDDNSSDKAPNDNSHVSSGTRTPSPGDGKSSGKSHDKGRYKSSRKTS